MKGISKITCVSLFVAFAGIHTAANAAPVNIGGFISNGYIKSSHYNYLVNSSEGDFDFVELGVNAVWSPLDRTTINGQLFTFELGPYGNYDPLIDYLFVDYSATDTFGIRLGRVKRPNGIYNEIQDIDIARTSILLPMGAMYDPRYRDFGASVDGVSLYGSFYIGNLQSIDYNIYHGEIDLSANGGIAAFALTATSRTLANAQVTEFKGKTNSGAQIWWNTPISGLRTGLSYSYYPDVHLVIDANFPPAYPPNPMLANAPVSSDTVIDVKSARASLEYFIGQWTLISELENQRYYTHSFQSVAGNTTPTIYESSGIDSWYISATRNLPANFSAGLTYAEFYGSFGGQSDDNVPHNNDWQISVRYDATDNWSLKIEYHSIEGTDRLFNQNGQNPILDEKSWTLFAAKSSFSF